MYLGRVDKLPFTHIRPSLSWFALHLVSKAGDTPVENAVDSGNLAIVHALLKAKADPNAKGRVRR